MKTCTNIELTPEDVEKFKLFQQYYDTFTALVEAKVFEQKTASITLNFDHDGVLQTIERKDMMYSKRFSKA